MAERQLRQGGIEAIRMQAIAREVGLTHPALHYHFRNRDGLLAALFARASARMRQEILAELLRGPLGDRQARADLFVRIYDRVADPARAAPLAALIACGHEPFPSSEPAGLAELAERLHALRQAAHPGAAGDEASTRYGLLTLTLLMFGDLLLGDATRRRLGLPSDRAAHDHYRRWIAERLPALVELLASPPGGRP